MCANCFSSAEVAVGQAALIGVVLKAPVHRALARRQLVAPPDPVGRDARTVRFLRHLELDPVAILGAAAVAAADAWVPAPQTAGSRWRSRLAWARPIGSQSLLTAQ